ncbi:MAG TPA: inositol monophosphatase family protein [Bryobacteraceae bacterium]|nr:inositol monophosphatase family protein [Bryobacteraceae bacterium]
MSYEHELDVARRAAVRAGEQALRHQKAGLQAEDKPDLSPVTIADREGERLISSMLTEAFPQDGLLGEEGVHKDSNMGRRWIIDPIDGTRDFLRGLPTWGVLIGLEEGADVVAGVAHFPAQNTTYYAARGTGAWRNDTRIHVSKVASASQALLCVNGFNDVLEYPFAPRLLTWMKEFWAVRSFGGCQDAMLVAAGQAEAWLEPHGKPWDFAALKVIAEEAGAVFFNFDGHSSIYAGNCGISVPALEVELRRLVIGTSRTPRADAPPPIQGARI